MGKKIKITGVILLLTLLGYYFRSHIPIDIASDKIESTIIYLALFNGILFIIFLYKLKFSRPIYWFIAIILTLHNLSQTLVHLRYYADYEDVEVVDSNSDKKAIKQVQGIAFQDEDNYRVIEVYEIIPEIRIIKSIKSE